MPRAPRPRVYRAPGPRCSPRPSRSPAPGAHPRAGPALRTSPLGPRPLTREQRAPGQGRDGTGRARPGRRAAASGSGEGRRARGAWRCGAGGGRVRGASVSARGRRAGGRAPGGERRPRANEEGGGDSKLPPREPASLAGGSRGQRGCSRGPGLPRHLGSGPARAAAAGAAGAALAAALAAAARGKRTGAPARFGGRRGAPLRCAAREVRARIRLLGPGPRQRSHRWRTSAADTWVPGPACRPGRHPRPGSPAPESWFRVSGPGPPAPPSGCRRPPRAHYF